MITDGSDYTHRIFFIFVKAINMVAEKIVEAFFYNSQAVFFFNMFLNQWCKGRQPTVRGRFFVYLI